MKHIEINDDEFFATYKPRKNPFQEDAPWNGCMMETHGPEYERVHEVYREAPDTVWTVLDADGVLMVSNGFHWVNRMGYIITEVAAPEDTFVDVVDPDEPLDVDEDDEGDED